MSEVCVRVAVRIRPLLRRELLHRHQVCVRVAPPGSGQVLLGPDRLFSFDHAFGPTAGQDEVYESCVQPLVESLLDGYNATVFCYGQTGSGKTYTLGGGSQDEGGIIDRVAQDVFLLLAERKSDGSVEATVRVSYMELYREELRDLLDMNTDYKELHIREDEKGNTVVVGAREMVVASAEELLGAVEMGNALRHTGATGMNEHSSRSHVILTLQISVRSLKSARSSKLCLVDLAGSERAGKTGNAGAQLKESALINTGLLALGNVIRALSDRGAHVPYRDAKITRLLRDSLGGNAHTVMVACVSPSHHFVAETLNVLQFASKARHVRNCPGPAPLLANVKSEPDSWQPAMARLGELEYEVQTLRELLKQKEKDAEETGREKTGPGGGEGGGVTQPGQIRVPDPDKRPNQDSAVQYLFLTKEAAALLADISEASLSDSFRQRLREWQERLAAVSQSHQTDIIDGSEGAGDQPFHGSALKLREELHKCQEALKEKEQILTQKDEELRQIQKEVQELLDEKRTQRLALEEEKERSGLQKEQLVNQQIVIDRLRSNLLAVHETTPGATGEARPSGYLCQRAHSVPLIRPSSLQRPSRKIHSSPPACSLERVMAAFKMRGHLLLAGIEEKDEVYSPFITQQQESKETSLKISGEEEEEEEMEVERDVCRDEFRHSLNRTWTSWEKKLLLEPKSAGVETCNGNTAVHESDQVKENLTKTVRRASNAERRIHELTVNMRMKEELIKELDRTERETRALERDDRGVGNALGRLSMQSQSIRAEVYHSLQNMRQERAKLQSGLREMDESADINRALHQTRDSAVPEGFPWEASNRMLRGRSWLEKEEERVIQTRAELRELEEELKRKEEVLQHREACLQQKTKLEIKMLQSSQALSRDLMRVSVQLESVEEQLQSERSVRKTKGVTVGELEKERDMLRMKRDTLEAQLRNNRGLTVEEEHSLLQLQEAVEALDAALEFKNNSIQDRQKHLSVTHQPLRESAGAEPARHGDITRKLKKLSLPEAVELLIKYFNKVVCLREAERRLRLRCEELELHAGEQEAALRKMEAAIQRLALESDRRLTQQHRAHQNNIQLLLQELKEGVSGDAQQSVQDRVQHLEKELFFYKNSSRQLKKKLKELLSDAPSADDRSTHAPESRPVREDNPKAYCEEAGKTTHISTTYTKIYTEQTDGKPLTASPAAVQALSKTKASEQRKGLAHGRSTRGQPEESLEITPVRLRRRELREIPAAELQLLGSTTRRHQSAVYSSSESMMEDSIEVPRNK
ncbi:kinesin-like protein KIF27 [Fundulus heteroclitus]|uniref:kinesin-like protein KIF27 n=1 Tax=Fundulus heteroclitus TaxID=8078 RepID=UPI00165AA92B|nr:kinesin-like protein KIF27 [Fundulus heteroclitus]